MCIPYYLTHFNVASFEGHLEGCLLEQVCRLIVYRCLVEEELDELGLTLCCSEVKEAVLVTKLHVN